MTLTQRVEELAITYGSDTRRSIGEFVLRIKGKLGAYSTQQVAEETYTSKAALVRFAKALGYSGWREFASAYLSELRYQEEHYSDVDPNFPFHQENSTKDIMNLMCSLQMESLMDSADLNAPETIDRIVELMAHSRRIALFGVSPNNLLGELFRRRMLTVGRLVEIPSLGDTGLLANSLGQEDCALIISYSGNTKDREPLKVMRFLIPNGVPIVALTSRGENLLRKNASYTLTISSQEKLYSKISTFATETSIHYLLNVLFSAYFNRDYQRNLEQKVSTGKVLESTRFSENEELREDKETADLH